MIRPTDAAGATFEIESVRLVYGRSTWPGIPSGVGWQGLKEIYREIARGPRARSHRFTVTLPERPWLDLAVGTMEDEPVTFTRERSRRRTTDDAGEALLEHTVTTPHRWEPRPIDLARFAGQDVTPVAVARVRRKPGTLGFWGGAGDPQPRDSGVGIGARIRGRAA